MRPLASSNCKPDTVMAVRHANDVAEDGKKKDNAGNGIREICHT